MRNFVQFVLEVGAFLSYQSIELYVIKPTYLSKSKIVSPIFQLKLQPVFSFLLSLPLNQITHQSTTLTTNTTNARTTPPPKHLPTILTFKQLRIIMQRLTKKNKKTLCVRTLAC